MSCCPVRQSLNCKVNKKKVVRTICLLFQRIKESSQTSPNLFTFCFIAFCSEIVGCSDRLKVSFMLHRSNHFVLPDPFTTNLTEVVQDETCMYNKWQLINVNIHCSLKTKIRDIKMGHSRVFLYAFYLSFSAHA